MMRAADDAELVLALPADADAWVCDEGGSVFAQAARRRGVAWAETCEQWESECGFTVEGGRLKDCRSGRGSGPDSGDAVARTCVGFELQMGAGIDCCIHCIVRNGVMRDEMSRFRPSSLLRVEVDEWQTERPFVTFYGGVAPRSLRGLVRPRCGPARRRDRGGHSTADHRYPWSITLLS